MLLVGGEFLPIASWGPQKWAPPPPPTGELQYSQELRRKLKQEGEMFASHFSDVLQLQAEKPKTAFTHQNKPSLLSSALSFLLRCSV